MDMALSTDLIEAGFPDKAPCSLPGMPAYDATSVMAAISIVLALFERGSSGDGHYIDVSVHENARLAIYPWMVTLHSYNRTPDGPPPAPEGRMGAAVYPVYPCKDGYVRVVALTPWQWDALLKVIGEPEVLARSGMARVAAPHHPRRRAVRHHGGVHGELHDDGAVRGGAPGGCPDRPYPRPVRFRRQPPDPGAGVLPRHAASRDREVPVSGASVQVDGDPVPRGALGASPGRAQRCHPVRAPGSLADGAGRTSTRGCRVGAVMKRAPLEGIRVVSLGTGGVVPDCVKTLGEMGADVIKIESKQNLDMMRTIGGDINGVPGFNEINRNKRSFGVEPEDRNGPRARQRLIKKSDVVTENFRAGVVERLGLDYESVRQIKPDIVYLSSQGFGKTGPYSGHKAYGPLMAAASGMLRLWAHPDDPYPVGSTVPIPDHFASKHAVLAILAALDYRRRTGKGQFIDMSLVEVGANLIGAYYLEHTVNAREPQPHGKSDSLRGTLRRLSLQGGRSVVRHQRVHRRGVALPLPCHGPPRLPARAPSARCRAGGAAVYPGRKALGGGCRPGEVLRPGQPRHADGQTGKPD